jgi:predicted anti-sigma-YlaC factor YlaD
MAINNVDKKQQMTINLLVAGVGIISAIVGIMAYRNNSKHQTFQKEVLAIDREIKLLQLAREKQKAEDDGLISSES